MGVWLFRSILALAVLGSISAASSAESDNGKKRTGLSNLKQSEVDEMVNNVLQWLQTFYKQNNRKARQYGSGKPEKPRPFERPSYLPPTGYPLPGPKPTPGYEEGPSSPFGSPTNTGSYQSPSNQPSTATQREYQSISSGYQPSTPGYDTKTSYQPITNEYKPSPSQGSTNDYQSPSNQPSTSEYLPPSNVPATNENQATVYNSNSYEPSTNRYEPSDTQPPSSEYQPPLTSPNQSFSPSSPTSPTGSNTDDEEDDQNLDVTQETESTASTSATKSESTAEDDDRHPPHIHAIDVTCGKEMMTINIEFNKAYNGIIYSKGFFKQASCVYVSPNSNQVKYSFTVSLNECGTEFKTAFDTEGKAYLENTLVLQNEEGIQEVWDHIHRVRCLWEGSLSQQLQSSLSVGMLRQETTNFNGDTAMAKLDIRLGRGPFAEPLNGLVKIGETLTLVISVTGDAGFDIQVKKCEAKDADGNNVVQLTDENGCVLKPKLFGAFQKTRDTGNTGASILAYAFFNAFKFPDEMDMLIQCDVDLCKTDCEACTLEQSLEPAKRRKRSISDRANHTLGEPVTILKGFRVIFPEDAVDDLRRDSVCVSYMSFLLGAIFILAVAVTSSISAGILWLKIQNRNLKK